MKYIVSACLLGINCKYNGENNRSQQLINFLKDKEYLPVCPEMLGGLPSPRPCCERKGNRILTQLGDDVTSAFFAGAEIALHQAQEFQGETAILQPRSPSCGYGRIYSGSFDGRLIKGDGVYAQMLINAGIQVYSADEFLQLLEEGKKKQIPS